MKTDNKKVENKEDLPCGIKKEQIFSQAEFEKYKKNKESDIEEILRNDDYRGYEYYTILFKNDDADEVFIKIKKEVKIKLYDSSTTDEDPVHSIEFDGVSYDIIGSEITQREAEIFKAAIYAERERIWDQSAGLVDDKIMNKLLNHDLVFCKECDWSGYISDVIKANARVENNNLQTYPNDLNCPKCNKHILSMSGCLE